MNGRLFLAGLLVLSLPDAAFALQTTENAMQKALDIATGREAVIMATLSVAALGYMWLFGNMSFRYAGSIIGGIVFIFGGAQIVSYFQA